MCATLEEMNQIMEEIKSLERLKEETEETISALKIKAIEFLKENEETCKTTNEKGKEILRFIGNISHLQKKNGGQENVHKL